MPAKIAICTNTAAGTAQRKGDYVNRGCGIGREATLYLLERGVPSYIVAIDFTAGPPRYRLYAGAYETLQEAEAMAGLLENAGVTGHSLRRRTGRTGE